MPFFNCYFKGARTSYFGGAVTIEYGAIVLIEHMRKFTVGTSVPNCDSLSARATRGITCVLYTYNTECT